MSNSSRKITAFEKNVANRILVRRQENDIRQTEIADALGISFQQYQKNEKGLNRLTIGRLVDISKILGTTPHDLLLWNEEDVGAIETLGISRKMRELWGKIPSMKYRQAIMSLLKVIAEENDIQLQGEKTHGK